MSNSLNYPAQVYIIDPAYQSTVPDKLKLIREPFPCDVHLLNLRTQPDFEYSQFPSPSALMVLHRQGYDCAVNMNYTCKVHSFKKDNYFDLANVAELELKSLTGLDSIHNLNDLGDLYIDSMSIKTLNITFG